ncbi:MAG: response regulator [Patescibacteria group bacterium]
MSKKKTILLVDDTPDILDALELVLGMEGYAIERATTQSQVDERIKDTSELPNLILLDVLLSGQDGRVIAKSLKAASKTKNIPIIMMSAHPNVSKTITEAGADDFIAKPFEMEELLSKIKKHISKK